MRFRSKLIGILAVPIVALVLVAGVESKARLGDARDASQLEELIVTAGVSAQLAHALQVEEALSAAVVTSTTGDQELEAGRATVDILVERFRALVPDAAGATAEGTPLASATERALENLDSLDSYRLATDSGSFATDSLARSYELVTGALLDWNATVAEGSDDPRISLRLVNSVALARAADAAAREWTFLEAVFNIGTFQGIEYELLQTAISDQDRQLGVYNATATTDQKALLRDTLVGGSVDLADSMRQAALLAGAAGAGSPVLASPSAWSSAMGTKLDLLGNLGKRLTDDQIAEARREQAAAEDAARLYLTFAALAVIVSLLLALLLSRAITRPLGRLTDAAHQLATKHLPALVEGLRSPTGEDVGDLAATLTHVSVTSEDEVGQLARAFDAVQTVAVDVAVEQAALLRKGIGDIFVNLARRNQVLIDRQLSFLDELEANEQDPDQLDQLFMLDHLATRMRRNAESLLVLAGVESTRKRGRPVPLADVVRAAVSEVEDYARIDVSTFEEVDLAGGAAVDVAHLLSELMENATNFSPPESRVEVQGRRTDSAYVLTLTDHGIGMTPEQLRDANLLLARPPLVSLTLARSLGFIVVGRLAARFGVTVRLVSGQPGGTTAVVTLPRELVVDPRPAGEELAPVDEPSLAPRPEVEVEPEVAPGPGPAPEPDVEVGVEAEAEPPTVAGAREVWTRQPAAGSFDGPAPATLQDAVPEGRAFDEGLRRLVQEPVEATPAGLVEPPIELPRRVPEPVAEVAPPPPPLAPATPPAAEPVSEPVIELPPVEVPVVEVRPMTAAGLPQRAPQPPDPGAASRPAASATRRTPEEVRAMLSRYRGGLEEGRTKAGGDDAGSDHGARSNGD